ncbi:MAG: Spy/CpxP family protein refolding chaperone [Bacteroidales bacterium]|nr:Spy/CpxP family protein refolding chaperone [Bacteroidales bacterium]
MKTMEKRTITVLLSLLMIIAGTSLFAQRGRGLGPCGAGYGPGWNYNNADFQRPARGFGQFGMGQGMMWNDYCPLLDLTDDQAEQIKELRLAHYKEVQPLRAQMSELAIKHRNLMRAGNIDTKAINASIDERTGIMNKLMKNQTEFQKEFRNLLTDEQKMELDNAGRGFGMRQGMRQGRGDTGRRGRIFRGGGFNRW